MARLFPRLPGAPLLAGFLASSLLLTGCARYPENRTTTGGKQLIVTLRVRGRIQPLDAAIPYYYFALINLTENPGDGPVPVIGIPWGNGFAAPSLSNGQGFIAFVQYDRSQGQGGYGVYRVIGNPVNTVFTPLGRPDAFTSPQTGEATLTFRLDLCRFVDAPNCGADTPLPRYLNINLMATNNLPRGADANAPKAWDALGDGRQTGTIDNWVSIPTDQDTIRRNSDALPEDQEPDGDVREKLGPVVDDPDLDIVDWTVELRSR